MLGGRRKGSSSSPARAHADAHSARRVRPTRAHTQRLRAAPGAAGQGVETQLIVYKGFGHGINKPKERLAATWHNWIWFARHIWGEEVEMPVVEEDEAAATAGNR